jgi:hypothetical protein
MRWSEIINESESDIKFMIRIGGSWVDDIERSVTSALSTYGSMPTPVNRKIAKEALINAKLDIEETLMKLAMFDTRDKLTNRIENRFNELYLRLLHTKLY